MANTNKRMGPEPFWQDWSKVEMNINWPPWFSASLICLLDHLVQGYQSFPGSQEQAIAEMEAIYLKHSEIFENYGITLSELRTRIKRYGIHKTLNRVCRQMRRHTYKAYLKPVSTEEISKETEKSFYSDLFDQ